MISHSNFSASGGRTFLKCFASFVFFLAGILLFSSLVLAAPINDTFHINLQTTFANGTIESPVTSFTFTFNITESSDASCLGPTLYNHSVVETTDARGIASLYLPTTGTGGGSLSSLDYDKQYYLCYYRDGVIKDVAQLGRVPYAFRATQVNLSEVDIDTNLDTGTYNITGNNGFFSSLGTALSRVTNLFVSNVDVANDVNVTGNVTASWFRGIFDWVIGQTSASYLTFNGTQLDFSESALNDTINLISNANNVSVVNYVDSQNIAFNQSVNNYILANNLSVNNYIVDYVGVQNESLQNYLLGYIAVQNGSLVNYIAVVNTSMKNYVDFQDLAFNQSLNNYITQNNNSVNNWITANNGSIVNYIGVQNASLVNYIGIQNGSLVNYIGVVNTTRNNYISSVNNSVNNWITANNNSVNNWISANNGSVVNYISVVNTTRDNYVTDTFVPYTGASKNVDLGNRNLTVNSTLFLNTNNGGRVGVGVSAPSSKFEVLGTFNATSAGSSIRIDSGGNIKIAI